MLNLNNFIPDLLDHMMGVMESIKDGRTVLEEGVASGALYGDRELKGDTDMSNAALEYIIRNDSNMFSYALIEGHKENGIPHPCVYLGTDRDNYVIAIDPCDGSLDYELAYQTMGAPYTFIVTVARFDPDLPISILFKDIIGGGIIDLRNGDAWVSVGDSKTVVRRGRNGVFEDARPFRSKQIDLGKQIVIAEMYYPQTREVATKAFAGESGYLRSIGSAGYEMAGCSSGFSAQLCLSQKHHELGAAYIIVKNAGGAVIHAVDGEDLGGYVWAHWIGEPGNEFNWNIKTAEITGCNLQYALAIRERILPHISSG